MRYFLSRTYRLINWFSNNCRRKRNYRAWKLPHTSSSHSHPNTLYTALTRPLRKLVGIAEFKLKTKRQTRRDFAVTVLKKRIASHVTRPSAAIRQWWHAPTSDARVILFVFLLRYYYGRYGAAIFDFPPYVRVFQWLSSEITDRLRFPELFIVRGRPIMWIGRENSTQQAAFFPMV